ncbi:5' nucleotidase, deoxy (Pyrimidine), cytosolic type C protein (NT5C) [uncultured archaeon]|nr:5' nucleotidase, deoxy (Pyrimidine), cytosolic type C protein (NT5C) [uncultured archaeon]
MKIAVDIDGVLADQVGAVLRVIEKEYGLKYLKSDINRAHWTFSGREIWSEISRLLADPEYTLSVPLIEGSQKGIEQLADHDVFVVTARRPNTEDATKQWLSTNFPCLTEYYHARTGTKHNIPSEILIDDLDMNIVEFVKSDPNRYGILFVHPWSINGTDIANYSKQVHYCPEWKSVVRAIHDIDGTRETAMGI